MGVFDLQCIGGALNLTLNLINVWYAFGGLWTYTQRRVQKYVEVSFWILCFNTWIISMFGTLLGGYESILNVGFKGTLKWGFKYCLLFPLLGGMLWIAMDRKGFECTSESYQCLVRFGGLWTYTQRRTQRYVEANFEYCLLCPVLGAMLWIAMYRRGFEFNPEPYQCLVRLWGAMNLYSTKGSKVRWSEFLNIVFQYLNHINVWYAFGRLWIYTQRRLQRYFEVRFQILFVIPAVRWDAWNCHG